MAEHTVRQMVREIQHELRDGDVLPARARALLMTLTSLLGNCQQELTRAEMAYNAVLIAYLDSEEKANRAKIRAETSPEFADRQEARNTHALVVEMVRSLKIVLRSVDEEIRLTR